MAKVSQTAQHMVDQGHYASKDVQRRLDDLTATNSQLRDAAAERRIRLQDAVESQKVSSSTRIITRRLVSLKRILSLLTHAEELLLSLL